MDCEGPRGLAASHLLMPAVISLGHVMSHRGALESEGHQELLQRQTEMLSFELAAAAATPGALSRTHLNAPLWVQCDFDGRRQHLRAPLSATHAAHPHLRGVDSGVKVLGGRESGHLQPLWDGRVFHHRWSIFG